MEAILHSHVARLVLGYLKDENLDDAYHIFCKTSPYLKEEYILHKKGYKCLNINGTDLYALIKENCELKNIINHFFNTVHSNKLKTNANSIAKLELIISLTQKKHTVKPATTRKRSHSISSCASIDNIDNSYIKPPSKHKTKQQKLSSLENCQIAANEKNKDEPDVIIIPDDDLISDHSIKDNSVNTETFQKKLHTPEKSLSKNIGNEKAPEKCENENYNQLSKNSIDEISIKCNEIKDKSQPNTDIKHETGKEQMDVNENMNFQSIFEELCVSSTSNNMISHNPSHNSQTVQQSAKSKNQNIQNIKLPSNDDIKEIKECWIINPRNINSKSQSNKLILQNKSNIPSTIISDKQINKNNQNHEIILEKQLEFNQSSKLHSKPTINNIILDESTGILCRNLTKQNDYTQLIKIKSKNSLDKIENAPKSTNNQIVSSELQTSQNEIITEKFIGFPNSEISKTLNKHPLIKLLKSKFKSKLNSENLSKPKPCNNNLKTLTFENSNKISTNKSESLINNKTEKTNKLKNDKSIETKLTELDQEDIQLQIEFENIYKEISGYSASDEEVQQIRLKKDRKCKRNIKYNFDEIYTLEMNKNNVALDHNYGQSINAYHTKKS